MEINDIFVIMEIQDIINALNDVRALFKKHSKTLADDVKEIYLFPRCLGLYENAFTEFMSMQDKLYNLILQYKDLLPHDEEDRPIFPEEEEGQGFTYTKDNINKFRVEFDLMLHNLQKLFVRFKLSQTDLVQTWIKKHAQLECLLILMKFRPNLNFPLLTSNSRPQLFPPKK